MQNPIRDLLQRFQYSEHLKEIPAFRILIGGEDLSQVVAALDIRNGYTLHNCMSQYQCKIRTGLFVTPAMTRTQNQDFQAQQRNQELAQLLQDADLLILALKILIEGAKHELKMPIRVPNDLAA